MIVIRKILVSLLWLIVLYFGVLTIGGMIVGGMVGVDNPDNAAKAGRIAGEAFGLAYGLYILLGSAVIAIFGTVFGVLPFSKHNKNNQSQPE